MLFLVFQHIDVEHPGIFREFMAADGVAWDVVELDAGEAIPRLEGYDALIVMGGPMDVFEERTHPWLVDEKRAVREAVAERGLPFLGVCLGHQLLAESLGGKVEPMTTAEVGILQIALTEEGRHDPLLAGTDPAAECLQWHGCAVTALPPGGVALARSPACEIQAIRVGARAWGIQYHVELTATTISDWAALPEYARSLEAACGADALAKLEAAATRAMPALNRNARRLYDNFVTAVRASGRSEPVP